MSRSDAATPIQAGRRLANLALIGRADRAITADRAHPTTDRTMNP
ncbi:MAG TPA: hypothetical protein VF788_18235 [Pseudonocardiaceae bacterium]